MKEVFRTFILELINDIPNYSYYILISIACVCIAILFTIYGKRKATKYSLRLLFAEYLFLIYSSTVFNRSKIDNIWYNFTPFWSYKTYYSDENISLLPEILMNIAGFVLFGFLMKAAFQMLKWWQVIFIGFLVSISIETLQYIFKLGIAEFDDVFNNTLGVAIGYLLYAITYFIFNKIRRISK